MSRNRGGWTGSAVDYLEQVHEILTELKEYWPLTLRQVYYQLVAAGHIENNRGAYQKLSRILTKARLDKFVPWAALEDRTRQLLPSAGWSDADTFIQAKWRDFLVDYRRNLLQTQDVMVECWVEKDALSRVCHRAAYPYCVSVIVARGFSSISYVHDARQRVLVNNEAGQRTKILYFGDLDPSGWEMLPAMMITLQQEMELGDMVEGIRCALTLEQVEQYKLPRNPEALKLTDPRAQRYMEQFGDLAVELDALRPGDLEKLVHRSIRGALNMNRFRKQLMIQGEERGEIEERRERVRGALFGDDDIDERDDHEEHDEDDDKEE